MQHKAQFVIRDRNRRDSLVNYVKYVHHVLAAVNDTITDVERFESPYYDHLQSPLQPLMDNLESQTYEVFELDPVKYQRYEDAVYAALVDWPKPDKVPVVMVVRVQPLLLRFAVLRWFHVSYTTRCMLPRFRVPTAGALSFGSRCASCMCARSVTCVTCVQLVKGVTCQLCGAWRSDPIV